MAPAHNTRVSESGRVSWQHSRRAARAGAGGLLCVLALVLVGCATTGSRADREPPGDWEREDAAAMTLAPPALPEPEPLSPAPEPGLVPEEPTETWTPLARWCQANGWAAPQLLAALPPTYAVTTPNGVLVVRTGNDSVRWDGLEVRLGFAPQMMDDQPYVHALDLAKTLEPLATVTAATGAETNLTIVIDPGHGGSDSGASSVLGYGYEKDFTLDWAQRVGALLADQGWRVFLTRTRDVDLPLSKRVAFAEAYQADLFLSLHFNSAAPNDRQAGLETYCLTPTGMPSNVDRGYEDDPALAFPNNAFDAENLQLALRVHRALLQVNGRLDRGVRRARFLGVLRGQHRPAVLVEGGYLSNPSEARRIADPKYRQRLAEGIAQAVTEQSEARSAKSDGGGRGIRDTTRRADAASSRALSP